MSLSGETRDFLQKLHAKAEEFGHEFILPEHLLFLFTETPVTEEIFKSFQVPPGEIRNRLVDFLNERSNGSEKTARFRFRVRCCGFFPMRSSRWSRPDDVSWR